MRQFVRIYLLIALVASAGGSIGWAQMNTYGITSGQIDCVLNSATAGCSSTQVSASLVNEGLTTQTFVVSAGYCYVCNHAPASNQLTSAVTACQACTSGIGAGGKGLSGPVSVSISFSGSYTTVGSGVPAVAASASWDTYVYTSKGTYQYSGAETVITGCDGSQTVISPGTSPDGCLSLQ